MIKFTRWHLENLLDRIKKDLDYQKIDNSKNMLKYCATIDLYKVLRAEYVKTYQPRKQKIIFIFTIHYTKIPAFRSCIFLLFTYNLREYNKFQKEEEYDGRNL